jgi:hypothetical protein
MTSGAKRGRPPVRPEAAAERRRRWHDEVVASGLLAEQIASVIGKSISTVWSYNSATGTIPPVSAINALARRNLAFAQAEIIRLGLFDDGPES